jgi:hypothetical protein
VSNRDGVFTVLLEISHSQSTHLFFFLPFPPLQCTSPDTDGANLAYCVLSGFLTVIVFLMYQGVVKLMQGQKAQKDEAKRETLRDEEFLELQVELYGERARALQASRHSKQGSKHGKK